MLTARARFAMASGPAESAETALGIDYDPRVYIFGGTDANGNALASAEVYDPNLDLWSPLPDLPLPLPNCAGAFTPDYSGQGQLGYINIVGGGDNKLYQFNIRTRQYQTFDLPASFSGASVQYLDDVGGPLAQLFINISDIQLPPCTDSQTLWIIGGVDTEREVWYTEVGQDGSVKGGPEVWNRGPSLPLERKDPLVGRTFWRDAGITSYGISSCASILVGGGFADTDEGPQATRDVQLLVRDAQCKWCWITAEDNPTNISADALRLARPVADGGFGTEQWPETLVTGGRPILFGGEPPGSSKNPDTGSVQYAQLRFEAGRLQRDREAPRVRRDSDWSTSTPMPGQRVGFGVAPLSQENSSNFGGRRISRFLVAGGILQDRNVVTDRVQLFQLPVPRVKPLIINDARTRNQKPTRRCC